MPILLKKDFKNILNIIINLNLALFIYLLLV
jgi:hypothetical protein